MRYLCLAYRDERLFGALSAAKRAAFDELCRAHDEALRAGGALLLRATLGAALHFRPQRGEPLLADGPFAAGSAQVGGFFVIEARDLNDALRLAARHPAARLNEHLGWGLELRPIEPEPPAAALRP